jgi:hypothetical protein
VERGMEGAMDGQQSRMYRLYFLDGFSRVQSWQVLHCRSDAEALAVAADLMGGSFVWRSWKASEL